MAELNLRKKAWGRALSIRTGVLEATNGGSSVQTPCQDQVQDEADLHLLPSPSDIVFVRPIKFQTPSSQGSNSPLGEDNAER